MTALPKQSMSPRMMALKNDYRCGLSIKMLDITLITQTFDQMPTYTLQTVIIVRRQLRAWQHNVKQ
ncbi:MAG: hypothetical protein R3E08_07030 [Thiotrichaceae bacterium]